MHTSKQADRARTERRALGSMLLDPDCIPKVLNKLRPDDFSIRQNREIFQSIQFLSRCAASVDPVTVLHNLWEMGCWDELSYRTYLCQMMSETPTSAEVDRYVLQMLSPSEMPPCEPEGEGKTDGEKLPPSDLHPHTWR